MIKIKIIHVFSVFYDINCFYAHEWLLFSTFRVLAGFSSKGEGGASFRGGIRSLIASKPLASANDVILWLGEKPWRAKIWRSVRDWKATKKIKVKIPFLSDVFPPDSAPNGNAPVGVKPLSWSTDSDSSLK